MTTGDRRRYTMAARADAVARTRRHIVDSAADLVRAAPRPLSLTDVAKAARVSRTTIYRHFPAVGDLLDAVAAGLLARADFNSLLEAVELPDPVRALHEVVAAGTRIWATDPRLVRNLSALARVQPDAVPVIWRLDARRAQIMDSLAARLGDEGHLRAGLTPAGAADLLVAATTFECWDQLVTIRNKAPAAAGALIEDLAVTAVVALDRSA